MVIFIINDQGATQPVGNIFCCFRHVPMVLFPPWYIWSVGSNSDDSILWLFYIAVNGPSSSMINMMIAHALIFMVIFQDVA